MKALVYHGPGKRALEDKPKPVIKAPTDAIVKITKTTICGTAFVPAPAAGATPAEQANAGRTAYAEERT
jgi:hypothetical protein